jgi:two-component system cell cycle response regulator
MLPTAAGTICERLLPADMQEKQKKLAILLIDDDEEEYLLLKEMLLYLPGGARPLDCTLDWADNFEAALDAIDQRRHDVYLVDYHLGGHDGLEVLRYASRTGCNAPFILLTGQGNYEIDLAAMQAGAADYLLKDQLSLPLLERTIRYALERKANQRELERLVDELRARAEELQALHHATAALLTTLNLQELLNQTVNAAQSAIPAAEKGWLYLAAPDTGRLHLQVVSTFRNARLQTVRFASDQDYALRVLESRKPVLVADTFAPSEPEHEEKGMPGAIRSLIAAPLLVGEEVIGSLLLGSSHPNAFSEGNLNVLVSFSTTTTAAIQNALLHGEMQKLATVDPLTGLYNRRAFQELGEREVDRFNRVGKPLSLVMFDLDHFKPVNDTYGHLVGDQVLHALTARFRGNIRNSDIIARYGGDEFALLLPETDQATAVEIANRICNAIQETPFQTDAGEVCLSASFGATTVTQPTSDLPTLIARADEALYRAKRTGRGRSEDE